MKIGSTGLSYLNILKNYTLTNLFWILFLGRVKKLSVFSRETSFDGEFSCVFLVFISHQCSHQH
jgi:hypothetical protein